MDLSLIRDALEHFAFEGRFDSAEELLSGHINNTYHLTFTATNGDGNEYILQRVNSYVFKKPEELMSNIKRVTEYLRNICVADGIDPSRRVLHLIDTCDGGYMYRDNKGDYWRAYDYICGATAYNFLESSAQFEESGRAFGRFQYMLSDFPAAELYETIPDFHNTRKRYENLLTAVTQNKSGRAPSVEREIRFFKERSSQMTEIVELIEAGKLPLRVTHNDTKINNVMLDNETGEGICVIDLDTVMPGSALYDYGDSIRTGASTAAEDEKDLTKIDVDMDMFRAFTKGFIAGTQGSLTKLELELLPLGARVMIYENGMRFLTDYIDGDVYFKVDYPEHNLVRAHSQMKLLERVEDKYDTLCAITRELAR